MDGVDKLLEINKEDETGNLGNQGYVYVLKAENGLYKIGRSAKPKSRLNILERMSPVHLEIFRVFKCYNQVEAEKAIHEMFTYCRKHGEWFELDPMDIENLDGWPDHPEDPTRAAWIVRCFV